MELTHILNEEMALGAQAEPYELEAVWLVEALGRKISKKEVLCQDEDDLLQQNQREEKSHPPFWF